LVIGKRKRTEDGREKYSGGICVKGGKQKKEKGTRKRKGKQAEGHL